MLVTASHVRDLRGKDCCIGVLANIVMCRKKHGGHNNNKDMALMMDSPLDYGGPGLKDVFPSFLDGLEKREYGRSRY